jgi:nucleotide-binding universal stress UspA family protein
MLNIRTILHGTDFSSRADCALRLACSLAKDYRARLVVLHVVSSTVVIGAEACKFAEHEAVLSRGTLP